MSARPTRTGSRRAGASPWPRSRALPSLGLGLRERGAHDRVVLQPGADLGVAPREPDPLKVSGRGRGPRAASGELPLSDRDPAAGEARRKIHCVIAWAPVL